MKEILTTMAIAAHEHSRKTWMPSFASWTLARFGEAFDLLAGNFTLAELREMNRAFREGIDYEWPSESVCHTINAEAVTA